MWSEESSPSEVFEAEHLEIVSCGGRSPVIVCVHGVPLSLSDEAGRG
jgi:hypothetical protein